MKVYGVIGPEGHSFDWEDMGPARTGTVKRVGEELKKHIIDGTEEFAVAMDDGFGLAAAIAVRTLQKEGYPNVRLTCLMRWEEQAADWPEATRDLWFDAFSACDREVILEKHLTQANQKLLAKWMAENCDECLRLNGWGKGPNPSIS